MKYAVKKPFTAGVNSTGEVLLENVGEKERNLPKEFFARTYKKRQLLCQVETNKKCFFVVNASRGSKTSDLSKVSKMYLLFKKNNKT